MFVIVVCVFNLYIVTNREPGLPVVGELAVNLTGGLECESSSQTTGKQQALKKTTEGMELRSSTRH